VEDSHGQLLEVKKEEEGDSWWMTVLGCKDPLGTRDQLQHHKHSVGRETQPPPLSSHQDPLGSDPAKSQLIADCDPVFLSPMEGLVMVEYHDQMVLMMDSDLTDLTMLQDKITLQASDLMSREHGELTLDLMQAPDPILVSQDLMLEFQDPMLESQDPILESQDPIQGFLDPMLELQDPIMLDSDQTTHQDQIQDLDRTMEVLDQMVLEILDRMLEVLDQMVLEVLDRMLEVQDRMLEVQD